MHFNMSWHPRLDNDRAQRWMRDVIRDITAIYRQSR
jgi:hypothetical protein